jgi:hypothetical protein
VLTAQGHDFLNGLEVDAGLFEPERLCERLNVLDALDAGFGDLGLGTGNDVLTRRIHGRAQAIRARLEAGNAELYQFIRAEIAGGAHRQTLLEWFQIPASRGGNEAPARGFGYDYRDELLSGILALREPSETNFHLSPEMVFYQPTPVRHVLHLIWAAALTEEDILVDLGSGLGHVPLLASLLTGAQSIGIEVEAAYVASARECAQRLRLGRVQFVCGDVRDANLSAGTVFYLYSPFTGSILATVLNRLRKESTRRPLRICTLGPCTCVAAKETWLKPVAVPDPDRITVFRSSF